MKNSYSRGPQTTPPPQTPPGHQLYHTKFTHKPAHICTLNAALPEVEFVNEEERGSKFKCVAGTVLPQVLAMHCGYCIACPSFMLLTYLY